MVLQKSEGGMKFNIFIYHRKECLSRTNMPLILETEETVRVIQRTNF